MAFLVHVLYLHLQWQMSIATSSKPGQSQVGAFETPLLTLWELDPRILTLGHPYPAAALPLLNSDSDFCYPVLKPPLNHKGNQRKKRHHNRQVSLTLIYSGCKGCNKMSFITRQSYMWNKCCSSSRYPLVGMMLTALWRLIGYSEVSL